jgi:thiol-disulfide isomerase/thioredoxin
MRIPCLGFLLVFGGLAFAQEAASTNAASDPQAEKARALAINGELKAMAQGGDSSDARWQAVDAEIDGYQKQFGVTPQTTHNVVLLRKYELFIAKTSGNQARYDALVQKIAADPQPEVAALTAKLAALKTQPLELKFTAVDGREVDLDKLRDKVVLIDFWATWCGPCVEEVPNVVAAWHKYMGQGFTIVGISLDQDKSALDRFTKDHGMDWPQYFDGLGWKNKIAVSYDINSIPTMWLLDKQGRVATFNARDDLDGQIAKLLAQP